MTQRYPSYKPSGVEWIGEIPEHWSIPRLRFLATISTGNADTVDATEDGQYPFFVRSPQIHAIDSYCYDGEAVLLAGDGNVEDTIHHFVGKYDCHQRVYQLNQLTNVDGRYLYYYMKVLFGSWIADGTAKSTVASLRMPMLQNFPIALPLLVQQRAIADYLDTETARIDALISKKRRLIDLLAEHRTALITQTVTKGLPPTAAQAAGLPPNPPLKLSGITWLSDIPTHWQIRHLGSIGSFFKGGGGTKADEVEGGLPCVRYGDLYTQYQFLIKSTRTGIAEDTASEYKLLQYGDVLFAGSGETIEEIGKSAVNLIEGRVYCGGDVIVFRPEIEIDAAFLGYAADCQPSTYQKACMGRGVTVMHIYSNELKRLLIPLPPLAEQRAIAAFLERQMDRFDTLTVRSETAIDRLQEYRTALITAAVTGKIQVPATD